MIRTLTVLLLVGILGFVLLNPNCICANDNYDATMNFSPVYVQDGNSVFKRLKQGTGTVAPESSKSASTVLKTLPKKELACLGTNIYFESRGESNEGQKAVGHVTINRLHDPQFPDSICKVVHQRKQFSWTHDRHSNKPRKGVTLNHAMRLARVAYYHNQLGIDPTQGALYFNTTHRGGIRIGNHGFY